jgi:hypothetical protein
VRLDDLSDPERPARLQQQIVFVRRVNEEGFPGRLATDDEDVVCDRADDKAMDRHLAVLVVE